MLLTIGSTTSFAQLAAGSYAKNFTMQDINGNTFSLYNFTDSLKPVALDFYAVWCSPCWSYHNTHAFKTAYETWGPPGTNEMMLFAIEGDEGTLNQINGIGSGTEGNWASGTPYPILPTISPNNATVASDYKISAFPTVYVVCPNRKAYTVGQPNANTLKSKTVQLCPAIPAEAINATIFSLESPKNLICGNLIPKLKIQNLGTTNLTSAKIICKIDDIQVAEFPWAGTLARFDAIDVTIPQIDVSALASGSHVFKYEITEPNNGTDAAPTDNVMTSPFKIATDPITIKVEVKTDGYPSEISWKIVEQANPTFVIAEAGPYSSSTNTHNICAERTCYNFIITDSYGDGMCYNNVMGYVHVMLGTETLVSFLGDEFTTSKTASFCLPTSIDKMDLVEQNINLYPNPITNNEMFVDFITTSKSNLNFQLFDITGKLINNIDKGSFEPGSHNVVISNLNLQKGIYMLKIILGDYTTTRKVMVQ